MGKLTAEIQDTGITVATGERTPVYKPIFYIGVDSGPQPIGPGLYRVRVDIQLDKSEIFDSELGMACIPICFVTDSNGRALERDGTFSHTEVDGARIASADDMLDSDVKYLVNGRNDIDIYIRILEEGQTQTRFHDGTFDDPAEAPSNATHIGFFMQAADYSYDGSVHAGTYTTVFTKID